MTEQANTAGPPPEPEYGPGGYLPDRAAKRARKIVLREQMGLGWPTAAVIASFVLLITGITYGALLSRPPGGEWQQLLPEDTIPHEVIMRLPLGERAVLLLRTGGSTLAFAAPEVEVDFCRPSRRFEAPATGQVWNLNGRLVGGEGSSLSPLVTQVHGGDLYVDLGDPLPAPVPRPSQETPACGAAPAAA